MDEWCERGILALVLGILVFGPLAMGAVQEWSFLVIEILTMGVMLLWGVRLWVSPKPQLLWPPLGWVVLAFTLYAIGRYLTADIEYVARQEMLQVLVCAFLFFAIVNNLYRQNAAQLISYTLIFLAMLIAAYAICQYLTGSSRVWNVVSTYKGRAMGTYFSPNNLAGFLAMLLPLAVAQAIAGRMSGVLRVLLCYSILVMAVGLAMTFSRGGWAACGVAMLAVLGVLALHRNRRLPVLVLLLVLAGGGAVFVTKYLSKTPAYIQRVSAAADDSTKIVLDMRQDMWLAAERMWHDHFWWGVGPAHYNVRFGQYRPEHVQPQPDRAHNDYLNLLADWGTTGGIIVLAGVLIFVAGLAKTWRHVQRSDNVFGSGLSSRFAFFAGATAGLLALAVHSVVDFNLHIPANAILGVTLLALLSSNLRFASSEYWWPARWPVRALATMVLAAGIAYLSSQGWRQAGEWRWLARAETFPDYASERADAYRKAFAAEPMNFETAYKVGEVFRTQSFASVENYDAIAREAMQWYERSMKLNPYYSLNYLRSAMCLDWLDRHAEAEPYFDRAEVLDPNSYYIAANTGWHYFQIRDYPAAKMWLERSIRLEWLRNPIAKSYLELTRQRMLEKASDKNPWPADY